MVTATRYQPQPEGPPSQGHVGSGKTARNENFPVGSRLLPRRLRPHVAAYYRFARTADDIADSPDLSASEKLRRLTALEAVLMGAKEPDGDTAPAACCRASLKEAGVPMDHAAELLVAFRNDATNRGMQTWGDLMGYCRYSAAPVGRFLLDLHGESHDTWRASDALCAALQILNHMQDCRQDFLSLRRSYVPEAWLRNEGVPREMLEQASAAPGLRRVLARMSDGVDALLAEAAPLPRQVRNRGLRMEVCVILGLARRLARRLERSDPLADHVGLRGRDWALAATGGIVRGLIRPRAA